MSLLLWLKFLYFLRIFSSTGYLIKIIISVCFDIKYFLLILCLTILAFGDSMRLISKSNIVDDRFIEEEYESFTYVYRMILGDFDTESFGNIAPLYMWVLFLTCTVFNMIIMLNLLIAIISEAFARINEVAMQASY